MIGLGICLLILALLVTEDAKRWAVGILSLIAGAVLHVAGALGHGHWRSPPLPSSPGHLSAPSSHDPIDEHGEDRLAVKPGRLPLYGPG